MPDAPNSNALWGYLVVEECRRNGITLFVISPGARSTPLTVAAARNPGITIQMCIDERAAAFYALGYGRATGKAAALVCTSGTALANYFPAVVEASQSDIPLLVLSADRPAELLEAGANQAIRQQQLFGGYVRWFFELPAPGPAIDPAVVLTTVDQLCYRSRAPHPGPVHLNCPFREPLVEGRQPQLPPIAELLRPWQSASSPFSHYLHPEKTAFADSDLFTGLQNPHGILIAGELRDAREGRAVLSLAEKLGWPVLADVLSGLRLASHPHLIYYADQLLQSKSFQASFRPEVVVQFGGKLVSKRIQAFADRMETGQYWRVHPGPQRLDPGHRVTRRIAANALDFSNALADSRNTIDAAGEWLAHWRAADRIAGETIDTVLATSPDINEALLARRISHLLSAESALFLAASMPVRDLDMFAAPHSGPNRVAANRGASGIDGTVASAAGFARGSGLPTVLCIGDLALLHDLNSLALLSDHQPAVTVVVINNGGGGIFHFLPVAELEDVFEKHFGTPHALTFRHAALQFGLNYLAPQSMAAFNEAFTSAQSSGRPGIIEIKTDRKENADLHFALRQAIQDALQLFCAGRP